jgi:hypothetical protein
MGNSEVRRASANYVSLINDFSSPAWPAGEKIRLECVLGPNQVTADHDNAMIANLDWSREPASELFKALVEHTSLLTRKTHKVSQAARFSADPCRSKEQLQTDWKVSRGQAVFQHSTSRLECCGSRKSRYDVVCFAVQPCAKNGSTRSSSVSGASSAI